ncbi:MAG: TorF family putative porin [Gammaproteobacteria bacterium]|nr:TorF family putative porin [Gammaproteobacteria bacterium]MCW8840429.1 TorF family putative porin [Gammaproteobacteria bacterium]MCW8972403.1 TorF family putative porin [Gammaproteobacteria bacterium]MCW8991846.1 TorF family putative porin [Gammaproteobacteria bacterium]
MTKSLVAASVLAATTLASGTAMAELSGNVGVTSNYLWRGETQASDEAAVFGGIDYAHDSGFYVGTWTSSLGGGSSYELDIYAGYAFEVAGIGLDVGAITYQYPQEDNDGDTTEGYLGASYSMFSAKYSITDDYFNSGESAYYIEVGADIPVKNDLALGLHYGMKDGDAFADGYGDYSVSLSKGDFSFAYSNTDNKEVAQTDNARISATWTHSIDF